MQHIVQSGVPKSQDEKLINYLLLLRFGISKDFSNAKPILNIKTISQLTKVSSAHVIKLLRLGIVSKLASTPIVR